jgi:two-component system, sensor histidine kinase and response regulator
MDKNHHESLIEQLAALRKEQYRGQELLSLDSGATASDGALCQELNLLLQEARENRQRQHQTRARLLGDIDLLATALGRIAVGRFDKPVELPDLPEMDTLRIGVEDMSKRLADSLLTLERKVSELRHSESSLRQEREVAEAATRAKSDFLANMSHEIRTPLNAVIGLSDLALLANPNSRQASYLRKIRNAGKMLLGVINDVLDFSKIEAGKLEMESEPFDVREVVDGIADMFSPAVAEKGLELILSVSPDIPHRLLGDGMRLGQVLVNLVSNAVKFTDEGEVSLTVSLGSSSGDEMVLQVAVEDTGIGIAKNKQEALFQSFTQADSSTTRKYGGTGLGLAICQRLVELMGGQLRVESDLGKGSNFSFLATLGRVAEWTKEASEALPGEAVVSRVLVVEDNVTTQRYLLELLASFSLHGEVAANGQEALAELERVASTRPYDLVILDWRMPVMDGLETARRMRSHPELRRIPVIMLTAYGSEEITQTALAAGIRKVLAKPVKQSTLFGAILSCLGYSSMATSQSTLAGLGDSRAARQCRLLRVLLVEDNPINQQVALEILGLADVDVAVANNGEEAFLALESEAFDAILMDVQMPVLDGHAATRAIREGKLQLADSQRTVMLPGGRKSVPIIAMTAHALKGDRERCLAAGMDDYLRKPIDAPRLFETLSRWTSQELDTHEVVSPSLPSPTSVRGISMQEALTRVGGNRKLLRKLLMEFRRDHSEAPEQILALLEAGDSQGAERAAHTIKGMALIFGARELSEAAERLERALSELGAATGEGDLLAELQDELEAVLRGVDELLAEEETVEAMMPQDPETTGVIEELKKLDVYLRTRNSKATSLAPRVVELLLGSDVAPLAERVEERLTKFDFIGAHNALTKLVTTLEAEGEPEIATVEE